MTEFSEIQIIKASAGSGKTHTLVASYVCMLFKADSNRKFANILSVTFTNKAAEEMRIRILAALDQIIQRGSKSSYLQGCELDLSDDQVKQKALKIRKKILHDYSYFSVSTIDSFVQRVVRSFAFEFRLPVNFQIQLDKEKIKLALYDMLMDKMLTDQGLQRWIEMFVMDRLSEDKTWKVSDILKSMFEFLFKEDFWLIYNLHRDKFTRENLEVLRGQIDRIITDFRVKIEEIQQKVRKLLEPIEYKLNSGAPIPRDLKNLFKKLQGIDEFFDFEDELNKGYIIKFYSHETDLLPKSLKGKDPEVIDYFLSKKDEFWSIVDLLFQIYQNDYKEVLTARAIKENFYTLGLFVDLVQLLEQYRTRYNEFLMLDLSIFLRKIIGQSEAPFIYEKIGQRIENLLIDEFQDTSRFQWENFVPLIENSYSQGHGSLIVGDVKQSIYRWRNGDWRLLLYEIKERFPSAKEKVLNVNYRSHRNIVAFNNKLFPEIVQLIKISFTGIEQKISETIGKAYKDVVQKVADKNLKNSGLVEVVFTKNAKITKAKDVILDQLVGRIKQLKANGYKYSDIAILVRTNNEIKLIVDRLIKASEKNELPNLSILSNVSLFVNTSAAVRLIISALRYIDLLSYDEQELKETKNEEEQTNSDMRQNEVFYYLAMVVKYFYEVHGKNLNINQLLLEADSDKLLSLLPQEFANAHKELKRITLYDRVMTLIKIFRLNEIERELPYLRTFEDFVLDFMYGEGSDIKLFLDLWEEKSQSLTVDLAYNENAITVMTIHSSKGLAFNIVIIPFANWPLKPKSDVTVWTQPVGNRFNHIPVYPIKYKQKYFRTYFQKSLEEELVFSIMDSINALYVSFTRPREQLIVYSITKFAQTENSTANYITVGDLLYNALKPLVSIPGSEFSLEETSIETENEESLPWIIITKGRQNTDYHRDSDNTEIERLGMEQHVLSEYRISDWRDKVDIKFAWREMYKDRIEELRQAIDRGQLLHKIMSEVETLEQLCQVVSRYHADGLLGELDPQELTSYLEQMIKKAGVVDWFSSNWHVENEMSIILPGTGVERRPDRVIYNDRQIIVVDFKFASPERAHKKQVQEYVELLSQIYPDRDIQGYLLYEDGSLVKV